MAQQKIDPLFRPAKRTPQTALEVYNALLDAGSELDDELDPEVVRILTAQSAFETEAWRACWWWNLGNVRRIPGQPWTGLKHVIERDEQGRPVVYEQGYGAQFSAFDDLKTAAKAWLTFLREHYAKAWESLNRDRNAKLYLKELRVKGYYTATLDEYTAGTLRYLKELDSMLHDTKAELARLGYATVKAFQRTHTDATGKPLEPDGLIGPKTRWALDKALQEQSQPTT